MAGTTGEDSLEQEFSEVSDDSLTSGDETLRLKDSSTMKERLDLKMRMQEKRQKNDNRRARRVQRQQKIKMARRAANERRAAEEQEALANEPTPEEKTCHSLPWRYLAVSLSPRLLNLFQVILPPVFTQAPYLPA